MYLIDKMLQHSKLDGLAEIDETFFLNLIKGLKNMEDKPIKKEVYQKIKLV